MAAWVIISTCLTVFFLLQAVFLFWRFRRGKRQELVKERLAIGKPDRAQQAASLLMKEQRSRGAWIDDLLRDTGAHQWLSDLLEQSGEEGSPGGLLVRCAVLGLVPGLFFGAVLLSPFMALLFSLIGLGPILLLMHRRTARMQKIDSQLPVALEIMTISLRAGHSLAQTIELSAKELSPPLRDELQRCAEEHSLGRPLEEVLVNMTQRLPRCRALRTFVVAVLVLQQTGGNLIEIIERIIETLRMQSQYERKLGAMTAEGKSSARMLGGLPLAFIALAYLADPSYTGILFVHPVGQKLLAASLTLWLIGILWTRKLITPSSSA
ncbi:MAG: hypothetical protein FJ125_04150 [Deltaproteobacteria bacterium]|nr:hypothetical protein [Deltaproteobacteria bacterium]